MNKAINLRIKMGLLIIILSLVSACDDTVDKQKKYVVECAETGRMFIIAIAEVLICADPINGALYSPPVKSHAAP